jgi:anaerobic magnesium-protoporphyrin IX monomethyl ester cyclase
VSDRGSEKATDVVLLFPRTRWDIAGVTTRLPLALLYVGTFLQHHGFSVRIIDQRVDAGWQRTLRASLEPPPLWVGITCMTGEQIRNGLRAAALVREAAPEVPLVWGGVHPSILPEQVLAHELADVVVVGEGEKTALELTRALAGPGGGSQLSGVGGIAFERDGVPVRTGERAHLEMDGLPEMDYGLVPVESYVLRELGTERSLQLTSSRGCPMRCGYCYLGSVPCGRRYRAESPERTADTISDLVRRFDVNAVHIIDDEFFIRIDRARRVCELLIERGVRVGLRANCRVDALDRMDLETLRLLARAGFQHLYLGVESGSDRVLDFIEKGTRVEQVLRVNLELARAGIAPKYSFMAGFPTETLEEIKDTLRFMLRLVRENPQARTTPLQLYTPYPGTPLYDYCLQSGLRAPERFEEWSYWGWEDCSSDWLPPPTRAFLERAAYFTFFLDGKTVPDSLSSPLLRLAARAYGRYVRERVRLDAYAFMPEVALIKKRLSS